MTAFETAWIFLKNAPVPTYAQPKSNIDSDGLPYAIDWSTGWEVAPSGSAMMNEKDKQSYDLRRRTGRYDPAIDGVGQGGRKLGLPYGSAERMPRPEVGTGESSFNSERMNTGTSVFNPTPSWQDMGQEANAANDSMQTFGTAHPPTSQPSQYPQYTPELYNALMGLQQPNDQSKAIPRG